jgi:DNA-directed RNA polymerase I subunit RPA1
MATTPAPLPACGAPARPCSAGDEDGDGEAGGSQRGGAEAARGRKPGKDEEPEDAEPDEELREGKLR